MCNIRNVKPLLDNTSKSGSTFLGGESKRSAVVSIYKILVGLASVMVATVSIHSVSSGAQVFMMDFFNYYFFGAFEKIGAIEDFPVYERNYAADYPELKILQDNYEVIRKEAEDLLELKNEMKMWSNLTEITRSNEVKWRPFMLKFMTMVHENEKWAPETYKLIESIPGVHIAHMSFLDPQQHIKQHFGYYKGYLTFHLGLIIPNNNKDKSCYLRVNPEVPHTRENIEKTKEGGLADEIAAGERYYWHNGEAVLFSDMYLHDAQNLSNEVRVVLFMDVERKLPWFVAIWNKLILWFAGLRQHEIRQKAVFNPTQAIA